MSGTDGNSGTNLDAIRLKSAEAQKLAEYWFSLANKTGTLPKRSAFDPIAVHSILPSLILVERLESDVYKVRLVGTAYSQRGLHDNTGNTIVPDPDQPEKSPIYPIMARILDHPCGIHLSGVEQNPQGRQVLLEAIAFPLTDEDGEPRYVLMTSTEVGVLGYSDNIPARDPLIEVRNVSEISLAKYLPTDR